MATSISIQKDQRNSARYSSKFLRDETQLFLIWVVLILNELNGYLGGLKNIGNVHMLRAKIRFMFEMLQAPPWSQFPLAIHWLTQVRFCSSCNKINSTSQFYHSMLTDCPPPPSHMTTTIGPLAGSPHSRSSSSPINIQHSQSSLSLMHLIAMKMRRMTRRQKTMTMITEKKTRMKIATKT